MKKLLSLFVFFAATVIIAFLLFSNLEEAINRRLGQEQKIASYSALSFIFLVADIVLPIPSSLVMILNGKMLGFAGGAILSLTASMLSSSIGFYLGRTATNGFNRFFSAKEIRLGNSMFDKYGDLSIAVSKGIPVLSEAVSFLSGTTSISFKRFFIYSFSGHLPVALIYAFVGSYASSLNSYLVSGGVIVVTVCLFFIFRIVIGRRIKTAV